MRVIADHARLTAFLVSEGIFPDRAGRPYVLRRVMRRAIRHGHRLGIAKPFLHEVALEVVRISADERRRPRDVALLHLGERVEIALHAEETLTRRELPEHDAERE